jgi:hypothetical protein
MCIEGLSDFDDYSGNGNVSFDLGNVGQWNGKSIEIKEGNCHTANGILGDLQLTSSGKSFKIRPMAGEANVSIEKDNEGNTSATVEVTVSNDSGYVKTEGSVDQDGNVSGRIEAGVSWNKD